ncbi:MAG: hydroxyacid dehydrogenase [Rhodospirillales bacterium]
MGASFLITDANIAPAGRALLEQRQARLTFAPPSTVPGELLALCKRGKFDAVISRTIRFSGEAIAASTQLRVISKHGIGVDNIDVEAATRRGIPVLNAMAGNAQSVAEHAILLMLSLTRKLVALDRSMREGRWERPGHVAGELKDKRLGIVGLGNVGRALNAIARGFGMAVAAYDPYIATASVPAGVKLMKDLGAMLAESDVVSLHCPLTRETRGMIGAEQFALLKPTALFINTARGPVMDESALLDCLKRQAIAGAGLDVFADEPTPADNPLRNLPNVVSTPHIAGSTREAMGRVALRAVQNAYAILDGTDYDPACLVNPEALRRREAAR